MQRTRAKTCMAAAMPLLLVTAGIAGADDVAPEARQYTYAWPFSEDDQMRPRGGTTKGAEVVLDTRPDDAWQRLREPDISTRERDRRAILAMAGPYRTTFDFIETVGFVPDYKPERPYQSWGTEYVYVVADEPEFISLQHVIVMFFDAPDGETSDPAVVKHWRQDWRYQDRDLHVYVGHNTWERKRLSRREAEGTWSQAVFQVDDSPRYQAVGRWQHDGNHSSWESQNTWRPLPRREFSVRDDYQVLSGTNRHTITPAGWVQEEDNLKLVLQGDGQPSGSAPYLAREAGLNRYERIVGHDFSAGDDYWARTSPFWADVRRAWDDLFDKRERFTIKAQAEGKRLFERMFEYADQVDGENYDAQSGRAFIVETLGQFVE